MNCNLIDKGVQGAELCNLRSKKCIVGSVRGVSPVIFFSYSIQTNIFHRNRFHISAKATGILLRMFVFMVFGLIQHIFYKGINM